MSAGLGAMLETALILTAFLVFVTLMFLLLLRDPLSKKERAELEALSARQHRRRLRSALKWLRQREQRLKEDIFRRVAQGTTGTEERHQK